jgi:hypothetical protein
VGLISRYLSNSYYTALPLLLHHVVTLFSPSETESVEESQGKLFYVRLRSALARPGSGVSLRPVYNL